jgi:capsular polysaccharide biosynthesis protein
MDLRRLFRIIRERQLLFLCVFVATLFTVVVLPQASVKPLYRSSARILLTPPAVTGTNQYAASKTWYTDKATLDEVVSSERLLSRVLQTAKSNRSWLELKEFVKLEPISADYQVTLFALMVDDHSPDQAKLLTEALVKEFVNYVEELSAKEFANTRRFLEELVAEAKEKVDTTEEKLLKITTSRADEEQNSRIAETQNELEMERRKAKDEALTLEIELKTLNGFLSSSGMAAPPWAIIEQGDTSIKQLENAVGEAKIKLLELEQLYTDKNAQVQAQREKLRKVESVYNERLSSYVEALRSEKSQALGDRRNRIQSIENRLKDVRSQMLTSEERRDVAKLQRQLGMWEENYLNLVKQLYQARVSEQGSKRQGAITVLQAPSPPVPVQSEKRRGLIQALAFGLPFSLALSVSAVVALDYLRSSLRILPQIESKLDLPVLTVIPKVPEEIAALWESYKQDVIHSPNRFPSSKAVKSTDEPT